MFTFTNELSHMVSGHAFVCRVPCLISEKSPFLDALGRRLRVPDYFGANWDALEECLRDLSWIRNRQVLLVHWTVPALPEDLLQTYLEIVREAIVDWQADSAHDLAALFPYRQRNRILSIMSSSR